MSASKQSVKGCRYLYRRGGSYEVRVQVPPALRHIIGKGELKKTLTGSLDIIRDTYFSEAAAFRAQIREAKDSIAANSVTAPRNSKLPSTVEVDAACHAHFQKMLVNIRGRRLEPILPRLPDEETKRAFDDDNIQGYFDFLKLQIKEASASGWDGASIDAQWLCDDQGWEVDPASAQFGYICEMMRRARRQAYTNEMRRLQGKFGTDPEEDPKFGSTPPPPEPVKPTLGLLVGKFIEAKEHKWSVSTQKNYAIIFRVIKEICGEDTPVEKIDHDFCVSVWHTLRGLPAHLQKHPATRGKPIADAITIARDLGLPPINPATINSHLNKLGAVIRFGSKKGWITGDPMDDIEEMDPVPADEKRDPFTIPQLNQIFACEPWALGAQATGRPSRYWAPLVALYTGARLSEICGQQVDEMIEERGVRAFYFRHRPGDRHIKSGKSRKVPVHPELIRLGFWDFVEQARKSQRRMLFPDVSRDRLLKWGDSTSKWFARLVDKLELKGRLLSLHSFRHTFEDALKEVDLHDTPVGNIITGRWSPGVSKDYGSKYTPTKLASAIAKVSYPGLLLPPAAMPSTQLEDRTA